MNKKFQTILAEIYKLEPNLKDHEQELVKIIEEFERSKPESKFTKKFETELKEKIMQKISEIQAEKTQKIPLAILFNRFLSPLSYFLAGILLTMIFYPHLFTTKDQKIPKQEPIKTQETDQTQELTPPISQENTQEAIKSITTDVVETGNEDEILTLNNADNTDGDALGEIRTEPTLNGLGGSNLAMKAIEPDLKTEEATAIMMATPDYQATPNYEYIYQDTLPIPTGDTIAVFFYQNTLNQKISIKDVLKSINLDLIDLNSFENLSLQNLSFAEDKDFGHIITIDLQNGVINIDENYNKWPNPFLDCQDPNCYEKLQLKPENIPSKEKLIEITNEFIEKYGINIANYGEPVVGDLSIYTADNAYVPEAITVIYPLILDNKTVYDEQGNLWGLNVVVNIRYLQVSSVYNLRTQTFVPSSYEIERDEDFLREEMKNGGINNFYTYDSTNKTEQINLENPELAYFLTRTYQVENYQEIFVPAIVFSIPNKPQYSYIEKIIVPLTKDFNKNRENPYLPKPLMDSISSSR